MTTKPYTFKDGLHIPAGITVGMPAYDIANDPDYFPNPETFSPYRYLHMSGTSRHRYDFTSISDDFLAFGDGAHACPGQFMTAYEIKILVIELLTHFEIKFPEEQKGRPESTYVNMSILPDEKVKVLFKRRGSAER